MTNQLMGSMVGVHQMSQLGEYEKYQVLLTLAVDNGVKKYTRSKEELIKYWR